MDKLDCIRTFIRVVQLGSFTAVAHAHNITQGSVSKKVAWLEQQLSVLLLHRTSRQLSLTDAGEAYYRHALHLLEEHDSFEATLKGEQLKAKGRLGLSMPTSLGLHLLAEPIADFMALHPEVDIDLSLDDQHIDLYRDNIDIAFRASDLKDSGLKAKQLMVNTMVYCASPDYLQRHGAPQTASELTGHHCLTYSLVYPSNVWTLTSRAGQSEKVPLNESFRTDSPEMLLKMTVLGQGISTLPHWMVAPYEASGELVQVLTNYNKQTIPLYAVYKASHSLPLRIRAFIDFIAEALDDDHHHT
ncbi:LysR family transcriptional regulator [Photobacterium gaetbulicola]|uniref:Putative Transcriptional regulator, LysR family n=1 Tax=Photobacterium gaetbulicola Gung47 TaxID=658445 RepID=A0A0C5WJN4_9GAMM|nr:LysR family transcriptional regulator [Photobacterium gaetbulicola]AJR06427.1 putative Transcriptional regulator, LysR family [Photobacterium gaetbulicola Gung47]PSU05519.1 LysR family transcriptional regulator [Photobacterium gaetbulicola]